MASVTADLELTLDAAMAAVDQLEARIAEATAGVAIDFTAEVDTSEVEASVAELADVPISVTADADTDAAAAAIDDLGATPVDVSVDADTSGAEASLEGLTAQTEDLGGATSGATSGLGDMTAGFGGAQAAAGRFTGQLGAGSSVVSETTLGYGSLAAALGFAVSEFAEAQGVAATTDQILANQGDSAVTTGDHIRDLAGQIQSYSQFTDESVASGANFLITLGNIRNEAGSGNDILDRAIVLSADFAQAFGTDVPAAATALGRALSDPERGLSRLERRMGTLPPAIRENIIALAEQGDIVGADAALLGALEDKVAGVAEAYGNTLPGELARAKNAVGELAEELGGELAPVVGYAADGVIVLTGAIGDIPSVFDKAKDHLGPFASALDIALGPAINLGRQIEALADRDGGLALDGSVAESFDPLIGKSEQILDDMQRIEDGASGVGGEFGQVAGEAAHLSGQVDHLSDSLDGLFGAQQSVDEGAIQIRDQQRALVQSLVDLDGAYVAGSESGDQFLSTAQDLARGIREQTLRVLESGEGADAARIAQAGYIDGLRRTLSQAGLTGAQIDDLIETFARVPEDEITNFEVPGAETAKRLAGDVKKAIDDIPNSKHITITIGSNIGSVAGDLAVLATQAAAVDDLTKHLGESAQVRPTPTPIAGGGGPTTIDASTSIVVQGGDPVAARRELSPLLADHRRKVEILLGQR